MPVVVVSKENTDYARRVEEFVHDFKRQTGRELEILDPESRDGVDFCRAYGILQWPTIIAVSDDGQMLQQWTENLPTISEVSYYG